MRDILRSAAFAAVALGLGTAATPAQAQFQIFVDVDRDHREHRHTLAPDQARFHLGLQGKQVSEGFMVMKVERHSLAERVGLERGDVIHAVDGIPIESEFDFRAIVKSTPTGRMDFTVHDHRTHRDVVIGVDLDQRVPVVDRWRYAEEQQWRFSQREQWRRFDDGRLDGRYDDRFVEYRDDQAGRDDERREREYERAREWEREQAKEREQQLKRDYQARREAEKEYQKQLERERDRQREFEKDRRRAEERAREWIQGRPVYEARRLGDDDDD